MYTALHDSKTNHNDDKMIAGGDEHLIIDN